MASSNEPVSMALFCDFENVALGVRDANYEKFDIKPILERLLLKGSIVVKKAYCDWDRYKAFKAPMHEANFELIEIPHVRQSGKNSADIRLVVDALDLCYTKSHVNTFVIISGDSDFSPLVSKLRENAKQVIGVGVKQSTSDLLIANCDEFIFYDDLVRESRRAEAKRDARDSVPTAKRAPSDEETRRKDKFEVRKTQAIEIAVETFDALVSERGDSGKIWASVLKEAIKRRKPDFSESYYGFRTFGNLLEEAQARGLLQFGRDEKSGAYVYRSSAPTLVIVNEPVLEQSLPVQEEPAFLNEPEALAPAEPVADAIEATPYKQEPRRNGRGGRKQPSRQGGAQGQRNGGNNGNSDGFANAVAQEPVATAFEHAPQTFDSAADNVGMEEATFTVAPAPVEQPDVDASGADASGAAASGVPDLVADSGNQREPRRNGRGGRKSGGKKNAPYEARTAEPSFTDGAPVQPQAAPDVVTVPEAVPAPAPVSPYAAPMTFETRAIPAHDDIADSTDSAYIAAADDDTVAPAPRRSSRGPRKPAAKKSAPKAGQEPVAAQPEAAASVLDTPAPAEPAVTPENGDQPARKPAARSRRPRKASVTQEG